MKRISVQTQDWDSYCGDGCCYDWGTVLYVNGADLGSYNDLNVDSVIKSIEALGYEVDYEMLEDETYDSRMDVEEDD